MLPILLRSSWNATVADTACHQAASLIAASSQLQAFRSYAQKKLWRTEAPIFTEDKAAKPGTPIHVACVLERLPVVAAPPPTWEADYHNWRTQKKIANGLLSDYAQVKHIYAPLSVNQSQPQDISKVQEQGKQDEPAPSTSAAPSSEQEAEPAVPLTADDKSGNTKSMKRALSDRLYLLVKQPLNNWQATWTFPHAQLQDQESLRETCERALYSTIGRKYPVYFIGNAPLAHLALPNAPNGDLLFFMCAQVVDDPWEQLSLRPDSGATDYMWATRDEVLKHVGDAATADLMASALPRPFH